MNGRRPSRDKLNIFFVRQKGRLQCLNGAYLTDVDDELLEALFGPEAQLTTSARPKVLSVATGVQVQTIRGRKGQQDFADNVKASYGHRCCFPGCKVTDRRFLVGAHIARWSDSPALRGQMANGLCLCVVHDRAFELGVFTLDDDLRVFVNPKELSAKTDIAGELARQQGHRIVLGDVRPSTDALLEHWIRVDVDPLSVAPA